MSISTQEHRIGDLTTAIAASTSPTGWWRRVAATNFHAMSRAAMQASIEKVAILGEPRWHAAVAGDAAAAIALAIEARHRDIHLHRFDLAMTALTLCALAGDAAACMVVSNILRRTGGASPSAARLANSWLVLAFRSDLPPTFRSDPPSAIHNTTGSFDDR